ncbi:MAG: hypothetical protein IPH79_00615 [Sphingomonadales bacterium]|nr:hypothetical protein [Sphingomonadales bacterium]
MTQPDDIKLLRFNEKGMSAVRLAIEGLRSDASTKKGSQGTPISAEDVESLSQLAFRSDLTEPVSPGVEIDPSRQFLNRFDMSEYLAGIVTNSQAEADDGIWTWISILYISQLLVHRSDGYWLLASEYRYAPDNSRLRFYRHLVRMGWTIFRQYGAKARLFLSVPCNTHSDFVEQSQKDDVRSNPQLIDLCLDIFYDEEAKKLKKGVASSETTPGSFRRLVSVISPQLYMNFDLYEMSSDKIRAVLPREFRKWFDQSA